MTTCAHANLDAACHVNTVTLPSGEVGARLMTVKVTCKDCGLGFWFPGHPTGINYAGSATNTAGDALTVPILPLGERLSIDPSLVSLAVRNGDITKGYKR